MDNAVQNLINTWNGKPCKVLPNNYPPQCFDLAVAFTDSLGVPHYPNNPSPFPYANASQIYTDYGPWQAQYFNKIANTSDAIPIVGDLVVWSSIYNSGAGHVAVCTGQNADLNHFQAFEQNDPNPYCQLKDYSYNYVLGWLRPKSQPTTTPTPPSEFIVGNDISEFQGSFDWNVYKNNTNFVIIRSTYGVGYTDSKFSDNRAGARNAGLPLGFYHYAYPHLNAPEEEADWCLMQLSDIREGESIYLDFEEDKIADPVTWCKAFLDRIASKRDGYKALIYLNQNLATKYDWSKVASQGYKLWIAAYTGSPTNHATQIGAWQTATLQQWTNSQTVPPFANPIDGDVFFGNADGFRALGYKKPVIVPPPQPPTEPPPTTPPPTTPPPTDPCATQNAIIEAQKKELDEAEKTITDLQAQLKTSQELVEKIRSQLVPKKYLSLKLYNIIMALE